MKKVCFVADRFFWEEEMGDLLYQDRVVEFYFHTCHGIFSQKAVEYFEVAEPPNLLE